MGLRAYIIGGFILTVALLPVHVHAAVLFVAPAASEVRVGDSVRVSVLVDSRGETINNAEGVLHYSPEHLQVTSVSSSNSIFSLWVEQPSFSNASGEVRFNGGVPNPGYVGTSGTVVSIVFSARKVGQASLSMTDAAVRANDGLGTDVLTGTREATVTIVSTPEVLAPKKEEEPQETVSDVQGSARVRITSSTHPDTSVWYANPNPLMSFSVNEGVQAIQTLVSARRGAQPTVLYEPPVREKQVTDLPDGTWYFNARAKSGGEWGSIASYALHIDTTPPVIKSNRVAYDVNTGMLVVTIDADDATSGILGYEVAIDNGAPLRLTARDGRLEVPYVVSGAHSALVMAFDKAGNRTGVSGVFSVPTIDVPMLNPVPARITRLDILRVSGSATSSARTAEVTLTHENGETTVLSAAVDATGSFVTTQTGLPKGKYAITAVAISGGGIRSTPSDAASVLVADEIVIGTDRFGLTLPQLFLLLLILTLASLAFSMAAFVESRRVEHEMHAHLRRVRSEREKAAE